MAARPEVGVARSVDGHGLPSRAGCGARCPGMQAALAPFNLDTVPTLNYCINVLIQDYKPGAGLEVLDMVTAELTGSGWVIVGLTSIIAAVGLLVTAMPPSASSLEKWARRYGAALTDRNRAMVARYLRRTRTL